MNRAVCFLGLRVVQIPKAFADGLIWRLPPDGTHSRVMDILFHGQPVEGLLYRSRAKSLHGGWVFACWIGCFTIRQNPIFSKAV